MAKKVETKKAKTKVTKKETKTKVTEKPKKVEKPKPQKNTKKVESKKAEKKIETVGAKVPNNVLEKANNRNELINAIQTNDNYHSVQGIFSDDFNTAMDNNITSNEVKYNDFQKIVHAKKNGDIIWGQVINVVPEPKTQKLFVEVKYNTMIIRIPETLFFEPNYEFGKSYSYQSEDKKWAWRRTALRRYINAFVCLIVTDAHQYTIEEGDFKGETIYLALGDRRKAMDIFKDMYFFHRNHKDKSKEPRTLHVGEKVQCRVIDVTVSYVTVECCGIETRIPSTKLTDGYVENCFNECHNGDIRDFYVEGIEVRDNKITLNLTGRSFKPSINIKNTVIGGVYYGTVVNTSRNKNNEIIYTVRLRNDVLASIKKSNVRGYSELALGDKVEVDVTKIIEEKFVIGNCFKVY